MKLLRVKIVVACITFLFALGLLAARNSVESARLELRNAQRERDIAWDYFRDAQRQMSNTFSLLESENAGAAVIAEALNNMVVTLARAADQQTPTDFGDPVTRTVVLTETSALLQAARDRLVGFDENLPALEERASRRARYDTALFLGTLIMGLLNTIVVAWSEVRSEDERRTD